MTATAVQLARSPVARRSDAPAGSWWVLRYRLTDDPHQRGRVVMVKCPACGAASVLQRTTPDGIRSGHRIHRDGRVEPSIVCPHKPCPWHVHAVLTGWPAPPEIRR